MFLTETTIDARNLCVSMLLIIDIIGVIPEPPANNTMCRLLDALCSVVKLPIGSMIFIFWPAAISDLTLVISAFSFIGMVTRLTSWSATSTR